MGYTVLLKWIEIKCCAFREDPVQPRLHKRFEPSFPLPCIAALLFLLAIAFGPAPFQPPCCCSPLSSHKRAFNHRHGPHQRLRQKLALCYRSAALRRSPGVFVDSFSWVWPCQHPSSIIWVSVYCFNSLAARSALRSRRCLYQY